MGNIWSSPTEAELQGQVNDLTQIRQLTRRVEEELQNLELARLEYLEMTRMQRSALANQESPLVGLVQSFGLGEDLMVASHGGGCIISNIAFHKVPAIPAGQGWGNLIRQASWLVLFISLLVQNMKTVCHIMRAPNVGILAKMQLCTLVIASFGFAIEMVVQWWLP
jgi:hypothetical protein